MATATRGKMQEIIQEAEGLTKRKTAAREEAKVQSQVEERFADIENNTFTKIIFSEATSLEKQKLVAEALKYKPEEGKEKNKEKLQEFILFKEYLQEMRKQMAQEIIALTDTDAFAEMQATYNDLYSGITEYDKRLEPLMAILDAVHELRVKGGSDTVLGVFKEIKEDQAAEEARKRQVEETKALLQGYNGQISTAKVDIEMLKKQRKWFGLGGIKDSAMREILAKEGEIRDLSTESAEATSKLQDLSNPNTARETQFADFAKHKGKIRELLDLTSEQHRQRQKDLVAAARNFVTSTDERTASVLGHFEGMGQQIENLFESNNGMQTTYAILTEASKDAAELNQGLRKQYEEAPEGESTIAQMDRESKKMNLDDHITALGTSTIETVKTFGDLSTQSVRIKSMKEANRDQVARVREMHSSGVAGVADRLSTVLQAVSSAALNESSEAARMAIDTMSDKTNAVAMQEAVRTAMGLKSVATGMERALQDLEDYREGTLATTRIAREHLQTIQDGMQRVHEKAKEVQQAVKDSFSSNADIDLAAGVTSEPAVRTATPANDAAPKPASAAPAFNPMNKLRKM